jgi:hypothetical protein
MNYKLVANKTAPAALFTLSDESSVLQDYSANNVTGFMTTGTSAASIVNGLPNSAIVKHTNQATFNSNPMSQDSSFTIAAWVIPGGTQSQAILADVSGLYISDNTIRFIGDYVNAESSECYYEYDVVKPYFVLATHTPFKDSLYIDAVSVDDNTITEEQRADAYAGDGTSMSAGACAASSTQELVVGGVTYWSRALSDAEIIQIYNAGIMRAKNDIAHGHEGFSIPTTIDNSTIFTKLVWNDANDWNQGHLVTLAIANDELVQQFDSDNNPIEGYWQVVVPLDVSDDTTIDGVLIDWVGDGVGVETSLDALTWNAVSRGTYTPDITNDFNPTDEVLLLRVTFDQNNFDAYLQSLTVTGIADKFASGLGIDITYNNSYPQYGMPEMSSLWGTRIGTSIVITSTLDTPAIRTIELWVEPNTAGSYDLGLAGATVYQNGDLSTADLTDKWTLVHYVLPLNLSGPVTINIPGQVGSIVTYSTALSANEVNDIYLDYSGVTRFSLSSTSTAQISSSAQEPDLYAYDWAESGAG